MFSFNCGVKASFTTCLLLLLLQLGHILLDSKDILHSQSRSLHNISTQHTTYLLSNVLTITLLLRLPRAGGVPQPQRGGGDGEWQGEQVHGDQRHHRLGAGGGECPPDRDVECPLQPQDIQLLLRGRRGPAQHQVSLDYIYNISIIYL